MSTVSINLVGTWFLVNYFLAGITGIGYIARIRKLKKIPKSGKDGMIGYVDDVYGKILQWMTGILLIWWFLLLVLVDYSYYVNRWILDDNEIVDFDSYAKVIVIGLSFNIFSLGLLCYHRKHLKTFYYLPSSLKESSYIYLEGEHFVNIINKRGLRYFDFRLRRYFWNEDILSFILNSGWKQDYPVIQEILNTGLSQEEATHRLELYGDNDVRYSVPSLLSMLITHFTSDWSAYQYLAMWIPSFWLYVEYVIPIASLIILIGIYKMYNERKKLLHMKQMTSISGKVKVKRDDEWFEIDAKQVVVGDCVKIDTEDSLTFDAIIVEGETVADESLLTGESVPVQKRPIDQGCVAAGVILDAENIEFKKYYIYAGTVLAVDGYSDIHAVVTATGGDTIRGKLVSTVLFAETLPAVFDGVKIIYIIYGCAVITLFTAVFCVYPFGMSALIVTLYYMTILVNPLLPLSILGGQLTSSRRLFNQGIFCRDSERLTLCGRVNVVALDKTGTITESGLNFYAEIPFRYFAISSRMILPDNSEVWYRVMTERIYKDSPREIKGPKGTEHVVEGMDADWNPTYLLEVGMALTHSLAVFKGKMIGHPVEIELVNEAIRRGWKFVDLMKPINTQNQTRWSVIKKWPFSYDIQRMSVICKHEDKQYVFCKGSFESMKSVCSADCNFREAEIVLKEAALKGLFVIALAGKIVKKDCLVSTRTEAESNMIFLGLLLFKNELKPDSASALGEMRADNAMRLIMVTGDSHLTGIAVSRETGILDEGPVAICTVENGQLIWNDADTGDSRDGPYEGINNAVTGQALDMLLASNFPLMFNITVYGRLSPIQKVDVIKYMRSSGHTVAMCGDGGNDCGALRNAHAGLALQGRPDAIIASPFSTSSDSLNSLTILMKEARASVSTSYASFRFVFVAGMINAFGQAFMILADGGAWGSIYNYVIDLTTIPGMMLATWFAVPSEIVGKGVPSFEPLLILWSFFSQAIIGLIVYYCMKAQSWFVAFTTTAEITSFYLRGNNYETEMIAFWCSWSIIETAVTYSFGGQYRQAWWKNKFLLFLSTFLHAHVLSLIWAPSGTYSCFFKISCTAEIYSDLTRSWMNDLLTSWAIPTFGSTTWDGVVDNTKFPTSWRVVITLMFLVQSIIHRFGVLIIRKRFNQLIK
jgi:predicted P-type ATPase